MKRNGLFFLGDNNFGEDAEALATNKTFGVIVLGMHRSGTSMLTGLLSKGSQYATGDNLIPPRKFNAKGYFEREDVVIQNNVWFKQQRINILGDAASLLSFKDMQLNASQLTGHALSAVLFFNQVNTTDPSVPWIQKDPRMCVTLQTWLQLFDQRPAVLFTYRHPLEVAMSLMKRDGQKMTNALKIWMAYNQLSIINSRGLCRVVTNNDALLYDPVNETHRIISELTNRCGVLAPPKPVPDVSVIHEFIDHDLQHSKEKQLTNCHDGPNVTVEGLDINDTTYQQAMKLFCDIESGLAMLEFYDEWPEIK
jgi:hypothetical protein